MKPQLVVYLVAAFALCYLAGGWVYWRGSYMEYLDNGFHWELFAMFAAIAIALTWFAGSGVLVTALAVGSAFPAATATRVVMDGIQDPTSHNLWPFEVGIAVFMGAIAAFPASCLGGLLRRMTHRNKAKDRELHVT